MAIFAVCLPAFAVERSESSVSRRWIGLSWTMSVIAATLSAMVPLRNTWLMRRNRRRPGFPFAVQFRTSSPNRRSALARSAATCVAFGVPCSLPPFRACHGVSSASSKRTVPCCAAALRRAWAWLHCSRTAGCARRAAAAACHAATMNAPPAESSACNKLHLALFLVVLITLARFDYLHFRSAFITRALVYTRKHTRPGTARQRSAAPQFQPTALPERRDGHQQHRCGARHRQGRAPLRREAGAAAKTAKPPPALQRARPWSRRRRLRKRAAARAPTPCLMTTQP